nr:hypothetical protein [[Clostridium] symbiosum]
MAILTLTKKGEKTFEKAHSLFHEWDDKVLSSLQEEEKKQLCLPFSKSWERRRRLIYV